MESQIKQLDYRNFGECMDIAWELGLENWGAIGPQQGLLVMPVRRHYEKSLASYMSNPGFAGFFTENAVFLGCIEPDIGNLSARGAFEMIWLSNGADGFRVLQAFEDWATDYGVQHLHVNLSKFLESDRADVRDKIMERKGFVPVQTEWIKRLI